MRAPFLFHLSPTGRGRRANEVREPGEGATYEIFSGRSPSPGALRAPPSPRWGEGKG